MMKFEEKISGTRVTNFDFAPIFDSELIWLSDAIKKIQNQEAMNFLLDTFRFTKGREEKAHDWYTIIDWDSIMKISALEVSSKSVKEFEEYFGKDWLKRYIRFNH